MARGCAPSSPRSPTLAAVLAVVVLLHPSAAAADEASDNRDALVCLGSGLSWPGWNATSPPDFCSWDGVSCGAATLPRRVVVALDMEGRGLAGAIPLCVTNLTSLERIHMPGNRLSGAIPPELGRRLPGLRYLNLSSNALAGEVPPSLGALRNLSTLDLSSNFIAGDIPEALASSSSLRRLSLKNNSISGAIPAALLNSPSIQEIILTKNNLSGPIPPFTNLASQLTTLELTNNGLAGALPPSVGNLSSLTKLLLAQNNLQGSIPDLSKLSLLQFLDLSYNDLSGTVPQSIFNLSSLSFLGLADNNLGGTLAPDMGNTLPNITILMLSNNHFHGDIPASLANASGMQFMYLGNNSLTGVIPSFSSMKSLQIVMLYSNQLEAGDWSFFSSLENCTQLQKLNLAGNSLRGELPVNSLANLPKTVNMISLQSNHISGILPLEIGNFSKISQLYLGGNLFTGPIPSTLGKLQRLFILNLSHNRFSGEIPPSIGSLTELTELYLQGNQLSGNIPANLSDLRKLVALNLSSNALGGTLSGQMFIKLSQLSWLLDLSDNQFTGPVPVELGTLINLGALGISHNKFTGMIPSSLGSCVRLESLRLEGNLLQGSIPQSLANLRGIKVLDFSQNNLSGRIPEFLETFTSLQYLNMSFNNFEGPVPVGGVFANMIGVSVQGNPDLCSDAQVNDLPRCSTWASKRRRKFITPLLVALGALALFLVLLFLVANAWMKRRRRSSEPIDHSYMELKRLSYNDVSKATNGFSQANIVGTGQFGTVYKGQLDAAGRLVAVKVIKLDQYGALDSFNAECKALQNIRHRNLAKVITACSTYDPSGNEFKALIFEYMANGSLENRLHSKFHPGSDLSLGARICISVDIASALEYLHNQCTPPIVHCDLKPSNILFNDDDTACVCDFGLARLISGYSSGIQSISASIAGPRGSIGYIAPEYAMGGKISTEGDIYSYGILLLEILTGKRPTDEFFGDGLTIRKFVAASLPNIQDILHPSLVWQMVRDQSAGHGPKLDEEHKAAALLDICVLQLLKLGLSCSEESPRDRPKMHDIYSEVVAVKEAFFSVSS